MQPDCIHDLTQWQCYIIITKEVGRNITSNDLPGLCEPGFERYPLDPKTAVNSIQMSNSLNGRLNTSHAIEYTSTELISVSWERSKGCIMLQKNTKIAVEITTILKRLIFGDTTAKNEGGNIFCSYALAPPKKAMMKSKTLSNNEQELMI